MKPDFVGRGPWAHIVAALGLVLSALFLGAIFAVGSSPAQAGTGPAYLPAQFVPEPTPTPGAPPQFVKNIDLPTAGCPNAGGFNTVSGLMYIANNYSYNVSVFHKGEYAADIPTGEWPTSVANDTRSSRAWVTNLHSGVSVLDGGAQIGFVPKDYEPYGVAFNPVNGYVYVTDLDSKIMIIKGTELVTTLKLTDPQTGKGAGWMRPIVVDPRTGLVYAASWDYGRLYVIRDTAVIDSVQVGWGPLNMAFDQVRGLLYIAHSEPSGLYPHDISVVNVATLGVTFVNSTPGAINHARDVAVDVRSGIAYVTNPDKNSVTTLRGAEILNTINVEKRPWGAGVDPNTGYVYVTNRDSGSVSIFRDGALYVNEPVYGVEPFAIAVDTNNDDIYVINRGRQTGTFKCKQGSVSILH
jgi:DNA-binding beta-propeller fold protein YncE